MKRFLTILSILFFTVQVPILAQINRPMGHLTIIAENDEPFYLYINGKLYNTTPKKGIRIEDIYNKHLNIKVVFPNKRNLSASHAALPIADLEGYMQDITYSVHPDRRGDRAFMIYAVMPIQPIYIDNRDIEVYTNAGRKTKNHYDDLNNRWNIGRLQYRNNLRNENPLDNHPATQRAMSDRDFLSATETIKKTNFDNTKLEIALGIVEQNYLSAQQIFTMTKLLSYESNKLNFAKQAYDKCVDQHNYHQVMNAFNYNSSKTELNQYIRGTR